MFWWCVLCKNNEFKLNSIRFEYILIISSDSKQQTHSHITMSPSKRIKCFKYLVYTYIVLLSVSKLTKKSVNFMFLYRFVCLRFHFYHKKPIRHCFYLLVSHCRWCSCYIFFVHLSLCTLIVHIVAITSRSHIDWSVLLSKR